MFSASLMSWRGMSGLRGVDKRLEMILRHVWTYMPEILWKSVKHLAGILTRRYICYSETCSFQLHLACTHLHISVKRLTRNQPAPSSQTLSPPHWLKILICWFYFFISKISVDDSWRWNDRWGRCHYRRIATHRAPEWICQRFTVKLCLCFRRDFFSGLCSVQQTGGRRNPWRSSPAVWTTPASMQTLSWTRS